MEHIRFPVLDDAGAEVLTQEVIEVEREGPDRVRLLHSPALVSGVARGDVVELDPGALCGYRVVRRGGMVAAVVGFTSVEQRRQAERTLGIEVQAIDGVCEGGPGRVLVFSLPVSRGFPAIESFLASAVLPYPGASWFFGNVHGHDGRPLEWWTL